MPIKFHPPQGAIVRVNFDESFKSPEMVKPRLCVVVSKPIKSRPLLCTVLPLSTTPPLKEMPFHCRITIPFELPKAWEERTCWVIADMLYSVGFHRMDLLRLGKDEGKRVYQMTPLPDDILRQIQTAMLHGLSLSSLTKHL